MSDPIGGPGKRLLYRLMRPCLVPSCPNLTPRTRCAEHERQRQRKRNADPRRQERYGGDWPAHSRQRRAEQPWCSICGAVTDLTVDHETDAVWCRGCQSRVQMQRRAG